MPGSALRHIAIPIGLPIPPEHPLRLPSLQCWAAVASNNQRDQSMHRGPSLLNRHPAACAAWVGFLTLTALAGAAWDAGPAKSQPARVAQETWYLYRMAGQDVGHIHETIRRVGDEV